MLNPGVLFVREVCINLHEDWALECGVVSRPDYRKLGFLRQQFPDTPILALTATATEAVCKDVQTILGIDGCEVFRSSIDRPNLFYEVGFAASCTLRLHFPIWTDRVRAIPRGQWHAGLRAVCKQVRQKPSTAVQVADAVIGWIQKTQADGATGGHPAADSLTELSFVVRKIDEDGSHWWRLYSCMCLI